MVIFTITGPFATDGGRGAMLSVGDPITFDWGVPAGESIPPGIGDVQGHIHLDDQAGTVWDSSPIIPPSTESDTLEARPALYTRGLHSLRLSVSGLINGRSYVFGVKMVLVLVSRPLLGATAWRWDMPPLGPRGIAEASWRQPYQVSGTLTDVMPVAGLTGSLSLTEVNASDGVTTVLPSMTVALDPGASAPVPFPMETQNWEWIIPVVLILRPNQQSKAFVYTVAGVLSDQFHNRYTIHQELVVGVSVPPWKWANGTAAFYGAITAAALLVLAIAALYGGVYTIAGAHVLAIASAYAYSAASSAYLLAIDPPSPDPWFRERVEIVMTVPSADLDTDKVLEPYRRFIDIAMRIPATGTAMSVVEGRILGADKAGDAVSKAKQESRLAELRAQWKADAIEVVKAAAAARDLGTLDFSSDAMAKSATELRAQGAPPDFRAMWIANALPTATLDALEALLQVVEPSKLPTLDRAIFDWSACLEGMVPSEK